MVGWKFRVRNVSSGETYWYPEVDLVRNPASPSAQAAPTKSGTVAVPMMIQRLRLSLRLEAGAARSDWNTAKLRLCFNR
jgi:hypothetical protein